MKDSNEELNKISNLAQNEETSGYDELENLNRKTNDGTSAGHSSHYPKLQPSPIGKDDSFASSNAERHDADRSKGPKTRVNNNEGHKIDIASSPADQSLEQSSRQPSRRSSIASLSNFNKFTKNFIVPAAKWAYSPLKSRSKREKLDPSYTIEYSVFKPIPYFKQIKDDDDFLEHWHRIISEEYWPNQYPQNYISSFGFENLLNLVTELIEIEHLYPQRIAQGSSGSYFVFAKRLVEGHSELYKAGVFKPKDEEPYGPLSPKWTKWLHRTFFPCFFGRACLIPNLGYVSEAAACVLDRQLLSYIVPFTEIVYLKSPSFYYSYWDRTRDFSRLPRKIGSFQLFLEEYTDALTWFKLFPVPNELSSLPDSSDIVINLNETILDSRFRWSKGSMKQFREELEKLVILDYIMRNTDRGSDNWMIKIDWKEVCADNLNRTVTPYIRIGAIDSGLAFPWKRPDGWRSFPFGWLFLPLSLIGQPFSTKTRNHYLPLLTSSHWWETTVVRLKEVFQKDNDFKERMWSRQLAVLKGQAFIVTEVLKLSHAGPLELTRRDNLLIWDDVMYAPSLINNDVMTNAMESSIYDLNPSEQDYRNRMDTIHESGEDHERIPLLKGSPSKKGANKKISHQTLSPETGMSGFEYNLNYDTHGNKNDPSDVKKVIIERLEKVKNKPPVFTWC
ncbi:uncharacterized protein PRCAT00002166001 [Priceomyces carsonii]|uniref:uncharacterized protein n=1 Tax=Priceomyces carsonii TaxID=28549 RepID=UPI002ED7A6C3|nr:unnamed protein product [Priceomyces carsonii]